MTPFRLTDDILNYYQKLCEFKGDARILDNFTFIYPVEHEKFPKTFTTSKLLYYSHKTMMQLKELIKGKNAYIVPAIVSEEDVKISLFLNCPLLGPNLEDALNF